MGLLSKGTPLNWPEAKKHADHVRRHGIRQFLHIFHKIQHRMNDVLLWGDEIEYMLFKFDHEAKTVKLNLRALSMLDTLQEPERNSPKEVKVLWRPEYGRYMLEATPGRPYVSDLKEIATTVLENMELRRKLVEKLLGPDESLLSITSFPMLGVGNFTDPPSQPDGACAHSVFISDDCINTHPRFSTLTANIRQRRTAKVEINVPIFRDVMTPDPFMENVPASKYGDPPANIPNHIYMDCMCFGMGCSCLQVTFQAFNIDEARWIYDQLIPLSPLMLAMTAAAPIFRGYLADVDCRWNVISASVDDRTPEERGLKPLDGSQRRIFKSRYASADSYIANDPRLLPEYNDLPLVYDEDIYNELTSEGVDDSLAKHISHLFIRDPLVIYDEKLNINDEEETDHFENIQSTNWQTLRFKPPPPNSEIGWRVEFRSMEVQLTEFENAAFSIFIVLLTRAILTFDLNFYIPITKVDENMETAHKRNARLEEKFFFRKVSGTGKQDWDRQSNCSLCDKYTLDEIFNGKGDSFFGLVPLIHAYLDLILIDVDTRCILNRYLCFISMRASGQLQNFATWARNFVRAHPAYKQDSVVPQEVVYDMMVKCDRIVHKQDPCPEMFGDFKCSFC